MTRYMAVPLWFHIARVLVRAVLEGLVLAVCVAAVLLALVTLT